MCAKVSMILIETEFSLLIVVVVVVNLPELIESIPKPNTRQIYEKLKGFGCTNFTAIF